MLLGIEGEELEDLSLGQGGNHGLLLLFRRRLRLLARLDVDGHEAGELQGRALGAEETPARLDVGRHRVVDGRQHLAGQEALPDQAVERELVLGEKPREGLGLALHRARADRLVGLLGALLGLVGGRGARQVLAPEPPRDPRARLVLRLARHPHGVGAHVGDQADGAFAAELDALVELLGEHHGLLRREVELAARLLLERRGDEGRGGIPSPLPARDALDPPGGAVEPGHDLEGLGLGGQARLLTLDLTEGGREVGRVLALEPRMQRPVLGGHEGLDLALALRDQAHGHRLDAPGREAAPDLLPEERRELVADEAIEHAPSLLRVHLLDVDLARVQEGGLDRALGDLVEHDPVRLGLGHPQLLREMPAYRLALAVRVGGDVERVDLLGGLLEVVEHLLLGGQHPVVGLEAFLLVHAQLALGEVADMAHGGPHDEARIQIFLDRLDLGG